MLKINKKNRLLWSVFLLYAVGSFTLILFHEPWMDEGQAWLIARDLPLTGIFAQMQYEGTPALWHIMILPLAKSGLPYFTMHLLHYLIALSIAWILLFKSPYPNYFKIILLFSFLLGFEYVVVARNYSISLLIVFLLAWLNAEKMRSPYSYLVLLALLFNTNTHSFGLAAAITAAFLFHTYRRDFPLKRKILFAAIPSLGASIAVAQLISTSDNKNCGLLKNFDLEAPFDAFVDGFTHGGFHNQTADAVLALLLIMLAYFIYVLWSSRAFESMFILGVSYAWLFYIFIFKHQGSFRHHAFLLITLLYIFWLISANAKKNKYLTGSYFTLAIPLLCSVLTCINISVMEIEKPFSHSKNVAEYIKANHWERRDIVCYQSYYACSVLPYFSDLRFWYPDIQAYGSFVTWTKKFEKNQNLTVNEILKRAEKAGLVDPIFIFIRKIPQSKLNNYGLKPLCSWESAFGFGDENYHLYEFERQ